MRKELLLAVLLLFFLPACLQQQEKFVSPHCDEALDRAACYFRAVVFAFSQNRADQSACASTGGFWKACEAIYSRDLKNCYSLDGLAPDGNLNRDACFAGIGVLLRDQSICEKSAAGYWKDECYYDLAVLTQDRFLCAQSGRFYNECAKRFSQ